MVFTLVKGVGGVDNGGDLPMIAKKFSLRWHLLNLLMVRLRNIMKMKPTLLEPLPFAVLDILLIKMLRSAVVQFCCNKPTTSSWGKTVANILYWNDC